MKSTRSIVFAAVASGALLLTACGPTTGNDDRERSDAVDVTGVDPSDELTFWTNHPGGSADIERELIDAFTAETGIAVNVITSGANYDETSQRFQTAQGSADVDVIVLSDATWFPNYLNGALAPVDELLDEVNFDASRYVEALYEDYLYEGSHYGVPYARSTPLFYYNADHYAELGIDSPPQTWDEVAENSERIMDADLAQYGFGYAYISWTMANMAWAYGGAWSDQWDFSPVASDATIEALEFAQNSTSSWAMVSSGAISDDFASGVVSQAVDTTGALAGVLDSADFEVGTAFLPGGPAGEGETPTGGAGLMIVSDSSPERQVAAAMFLAHMTSPDSTAMFSESTGYMPVHQDADMSEVYARTPQFQTAVEQLDRARVQDFSRLFLPGGDLALNEALLQILTSDVDVVETLNQLEAEFDSIYETDLAPALED